MGHGHPGEALARQRGLEAHPLGSCAVFVISLSLVAVLVVSKLRGNTRTTRPSQGRGRAPTPPEDGPKDIDRQQGERAALERVAHLVHERSVNLVPVGRLRRHHHANTVRACVMCTTSLCARISNVASARSSMLESPASPMCIERGRMARVSYAAQAACARRSRAARQEGPRSPPLVVVWRRRRPWQTASLRSETASLLVLNTTRAHYYRSPPSTEGTVCSGERPSRRSIPRQTCRLPSGSDHHDAHHRLPVSCCLLRPTSACHSRCVVPLLTRCQPTNAPPRAPAHGHAHNEDAPAPSAASAFQEGPGRQRGWEA